MTTGRINQVTIVLSQYLAVLAFLILDLLIM